MNDARAPDDPDEPIDLVTLVTLGSPAVRAVRRLDSAALPASARVVRLDPDALADASALHDAISAALALPDHYGRNWDALADVLRDGDVLPPDAIVIFIIDDAGAALAHAPRALDLLATVVQEADASWRTEPDAPRVVRLVLTAPATVRAPTHRPRADPRHKRS